MAHIVIIGAGPTGLSAAYHLEKQGFTNYKLFEKEATVGGLCRSIQQDGFTFDYTGHFLHINNDYFHDFIQNLVGFEHFNRIVRRSFIYSHHTYTRYPFQINLYGLPPEVVVECIEGFVTRNTSRKKPHSFTEWVNKQFGRGFAKHFFVPYQNKMFAYDIRKISASWTGRFVPATSLAQIIRGSLYEHTDPVGYNAHFLYPVRGGIQFWLDKVAQQLKQSVYTNCPVTKVDMNNKTIHLENGHCEPFTYLINTMPLDNFLHCLQEKPTMGVKSAQQWLKCNQVINFNLGINREQLTDKHWVYFPETHYPFYRMGFPHTFSNTMAPVGCSSLAGEIAHCGKSSSWINDTIARAIGQTKKLFALTEHDILTQKIIHISHAYVIYNFWREKNIPRLLQRLEQEDIYCAGRYAQWKYASMQEAILDGKQVAEQLLVKPARRTVLIYPREKKQKIPLIRKIRKNEQEHVV